MQTNPAFSHGDWQCFTVIGHLIPVSHLWHYEDWQSVSLPPHSHYQHSAVVCMFKKPHKWCVHCQKDSTEELLPVTRMPAAFPQVSLLHTGTSPECLSDPGSRHLWLKQQCWTRKRLSCPEAKVSSTKTTRECSPCSTPAWHTKRRGARQEASMVGGSIRSIHPNAWT